MFNILRQFHTNGYPLSFEFALLEPGQGSQTLVETSYLASELFLELRAEMTSKSLMAELSKHGREEITSIDEYLGHWKQKRETDGPPATKPKRRSLSSSPGGRIK